MWLSKSLEEEGFNFLSLLLFTFISTEEGMGPNQIHRAFHDQPRGIQIPVQRFLLAEGQIVLYVNGSPLPGIPAY